MNLETADDRMAKGLREGEKRANDLVVKFAISRQSAMNFKIETSRCVREEPYPDVSG